MRRVFYGLVPMAVLGALLSGCSGVYFNTTFNAEKAHAQALDMRAKRLRENPDDTVAVTEEEKAKLTRAISKSSKVLELWPAHPDYAPRAVFRIAESQFLLQDYDAAALKYDEYLRAFPEGKQVPLARVRRAQALYYDGQDLSARDALAEVFASNPEGEVRREALLLQARMRVDEASGLEGLALYDQLLSDGSIASPEARLELHWRAAQVAEKLGEWERARHHALQADAPTVTVRARYRQKRLAAMALFHLGRNAEGLDEVRTMLKQREYRPYRADLKLLEGIGTEGIEGVGEPATAGAWQEALKYYREAVRLEPRSPAAAEAWYRIGLHVLDVDNRADDARAYFDSASMAARSSEWGERAAEAADALKRLEDLVRQDTAWPPSRFLGLDTLELARERDSLLAAGVDSATALAVMKNARPAPSGVRRPESVHEPAFLIAELYHFRLPKPDSARRYLRRVTDSPYEDSTYTRRALYALAWLEEQDFAADGGKARADSLYRALLERYPETEWAKVAEQNLGLPATTRTPGDRADSLFREVEQRMLAGEAPAKVMPAYRAVVEHYPGTDAAARALYAIAVLTQQDAAKGPPGEAAMKRVVEAWRDVQEKLPNTPYADVASIRVSLLESGDPEDSSGSRGGRGSYEPEEEEVEEVDDPGVPRVETVDPAGEEDLY